jgi:hypothetical protein
MVVGASLFGFAVGLLIGAVIVLAWSVVGFIVAVGRFLAKPPPSPPPGTPCAACLQSQAL